MSGSDETAPRQPAKAVPSNTVPSNSGDRARDTAPPAVPSSPSADTRGDTSTSTSEGPGKPERPIPDDTGVEDHHKKAARGDAEVAPPGQRVDDEHEDRGDKTLTRQE